MKKQRDVFSGFGRPLSHTSHIAPLLSFSRWPSISCPCRPWSNLGVIQVRPFLNGQRRPFRWVHCVRSCTHSRPRRCAGPFGTHPSVFRLGSAQQLAMIVSSSAVIREGRPGTSSSMHTQGHVERAVQNIPPLADRRCGS